MQSEAFSTKSIAFDKKSMAFDWKSSGNYKQAMENHYKINSIRQEISSIRSEIGKLQKIDKKSIGDRSIVFDTKSNGIHRKSIGIQQEVARKSLAFDKTLIGSDTKSIGKTSTMQLIAFDQNQKKLQKTNKRSLGHQ